MGINHDRRGSLVDGFLKDAQDLWVTWKEREDEAGEIGKTGGARETISFSKGCGKAA